MQGTATLAARHGVRLHTHLCETQDEEAFCLERFGCRPVDYLERVGWLNDRSWLAHGIWFDDAEIGRLGRAKVAVSHCPTSNMILASGCCPALELEAAGAPVGLGVDGSASNDSSNLIETVRHAFLLQRLMHGADHVSHHDALRWATRGSAGCLGRSDIGAIAPGCRPISPCSGSTSCASPAPATRWRRWSCAAPAARTGSWSPGAGWSRTARSPGSTSPP